VTASRKDAARGKRDGNPLLKTTRKHTPVSFCTNSTPRPARAVRRAGTATNWSFGDDDSKIGEYAWFGGGWDNAPLPGGNTSNEMYAHAVKQKRPNPWQLFDIHGNVWEWCSDLHDNRAYGQDAGTDPLSPPRGSGRVLRGGGWSFTAGDCRSAERFRGGPSGRGNAMGFRLALSPSQTRRPAEPAAAALAPVESTAEPIAQAPAPAATPAEAATPVIRPTAPPTTPIPDTADSKPRGQTLDDLFGSGSTK
jgi:hypothetical protein